MIEDGPLRNAFENPKQGVLMQRLTTFFIRDGVLIEETVERTYSKDGDYVDGVVTVPIVTAKELAK